TGFTSTTPANLNVPHPVWAGGSGNRQLFSGNYLNYLNTGATATAAATLADVEISYIEQVKDAVEIMVRGNTRVNIGLMRFDRMSASGTAGNSEGGAVLYPILDVGEDRNDFFTRLETLDSDGYSPLSETYYEALLYFGGKATDYSNSSTPTNQVINKTEVSGGAFRSPISSTCDKSYIVMLSAGTPTLDVVNAARQAVLPGFSGSCSTNVETIQVDGNGNQTRDAYNAVDNCLDELSNWAATEDVATIASIAAHEGEQNVFTHTIGLGLITDRATDTDTGDATADAITNDAAAAANASAEAAIALLNSTAVNGKGDFYQASDQGDLVSIFNKIISGVLDVNTTFSSPAVSVNAFNRSTHLDDLYFTLFQPGEGNHWDGNLKKYKLKFAVDTGDSDGDGDTTEKLPFIADKNNAPAVDTNTGFFSEGSTSYWSTEVDGKEVSKGGAASVYTSGTASRNVYTFTGTYTDNDGVYVPSQTDLTHGDNEVVESNANLTDDLLAVPASPVIVTGTTNRATIINWARGLDALSKFGDLNSYDDERPQMGDPLHAEPALVQYGHVADSTVPDIVAYVATNDGYLHAFNVNNGEELFSFIPQELLSKLPRIMVNRGGDKSYGLDGNVVAWINDANRDGTIDAGAGEHVYLYVTMRRGGKNIYALNVTDRNNPVLKWVIKGGTGDYEELGQTWSSINIGKVKDGATEKTVLMFGGGYDDDQDSAAVTTEDDEGRTVYIADADSGERLWKADSIDSMDYSIPARVLPLDISGDGYIDRLYAADMGGQIFRFDINNMNGSALSDSIIGGRIADLADASSADDSKTEANARRFYYPPDVALINAEDGPYHGLVISSGYRAHPLNDAIHDRIYMIKDRRTSLITDVDDYDYNGDVDSPGSLTERDLHNATSNLAGGNGADDAARAAEFSNITSTEGWYIYLDDEDNPGGWLGEKGLAEALIIEGVAIVTTYTPNLTPSANSCVPNVGLGKVFFIDILDATPAFPSDLDVRGERHIELMRGGIPPTPNVIITEGGIPTLCVGTECQAADLGLGVRKTYWYEV
ncbi:MAG: hypothetical protein KAJ32_01005, partial [Gammaproteobacteria bacterium]|nr:hypothetical protein [Gammaproteobacteria bacterium]